MKKYIALLLLLICCVSYADDADKLLILNQAKHDIKTAAEAKGVTIGNADLADYANIISQIPYASGGISVDAYMTHNAARGTIVTIASAADREISLAEQPVVTTNLGVQGMAISADGTKMALKGRSANLYSYTYDARQGGWVQDNMPDAAGPTGTYFITMSRDGSRLIVPGASSLNVFDWNDTTKRYEYQTSPDVAPATGYGAAITDDKSRMVFSDANSGVATWVYTTVWDAVDGRYEATTPVDSQPSGRAYGVAMSADGEYLAVAHSGSTAPARIKTYKWNSGNERYEATANYTGTLGTSSIGCTMSSDGSKLVVGSNSSPYVVSLVWDSGDNRYEQTAAVDYSAIATAPAGVCYSIALSDDASIMAASYRAASENVPNFVLFEWDAGDNRYEAFASYYNYPIEGMPTGMPTGVAISGDGTWAASSHTQETYPVHMYDLDVYEATVHHNPGTSLDENVLGLGFIENDALEDGTAAVRTILWRDALDE